MNTMKAEQFCVQGERITIVFPESKYDLIRHKVIKAQAEASFKIEKLENFVMLNGGWVREF